MSAPVPYFDLVRQMKNPFDYRPRDTKRKLFLVPYPLRRRSRLKEAGRVRVAGSGGCASQELRL